jgi:hypothetical protein
MPTYEALRMEKKSETNATDILGHLGAASL